MRVIVVHVHHRTANTHKNMHALSEYRVKVSALVEALFQHCG